MKRCWWCDRLIWPWQRGGQARPGEWWHHSCHEAMKALGRRVLDSTR